MKVSVGESEVGVIAVRAIPHDPPYPSPGAAATAEIHMGISADRLIECRRKTLNLAKVETHALRIVRIQIQLIATSDVRRTAHFGNDSGIPAEIQLLHGAHCHRAAQNAFNRSRALRAKAHRERGARPLAR